MTFKINNLSRGNIKFRSDLLKLLSAKKSDSEASTITNAISKMHIENYINKIFLIGEKTFSLFALPDVRIDRETRNYWLNGA